MMKKLVYLILLMMPGVFIAQCTITGPATVTMGEEATYTVDGTVAQCADCHLWVTVGNNATLIGDSKTKTAKLKAVSGGRQVLSATVLTPQGLLQCSKNIDIAEGKSGNQATASEHTPSPPPAKIECDIEVKNYKEVKYAEGVVAFFPNVNVNRYSYEWIATYANGETMKSTEKIPQFPYTKEGSITVVKLRVVSSACMREFTKTYDSNYWKWF